jgi:hypothetical protein
VRIVDFCIRIDGRWTLSRAFPLRCAARGRKRVADMRMGMVPSFGLAQAHSCDAHEGFVGVAGASAGAEFLLLSRRSITARLGSSHGGRLNISPGPRSGTVMVKAWTIGCDREMDAARSPKIDGMVILAIERRGDVKAAICQHRAELG